MIYYRHQDQMGLGDNIINLSVLLHLAKKENQLVKVSTNDFITNNVYTTLKRVFGISDQVLMVAHENESIVPPDAQVVTDLRQRWNLDLDVPYITASTLRLFGQDFSNIKKPTYPYIGIATRSLINHENWPNGAHPYHRYHSLDDWQKVKRLVSLAGYDIISFDSNATTIEQKIFLLTQFCDGVIAYEGGMAHLCHSLSIPVILTPWQFYSDGSPYVSNFDKDEDLCRLHKDKRTWFLNHIDQLSSMTPSQLQDLILSLKHNGGNNLMRNQINS